MFLTIFVKKSFFWGAKKKKIYGNFFVEITKEKKKMIPPDESRNVYWKSQEIWNWLVQPPQNGS